MRCCEVSRKSHESLPDDCVVLMAVVARSAQSHDCTCSCRNLKCMTPAGVDWGAVENFVDLKDKLRDFAQMGKEEDPSPDQKCISQALSSKIQTPLVVLALMCGSWHAVGAEIMIRSCPCRQRPSIEKTREWIKDAAAIVGHSVRSGIGRGPSHDEEQPLLPEQARDAPVRAQPNSPSYCGSCLERVRLQNGPVDPLLRMCYSSTA